MKADADTAISRLQQQLAFAEQATDDAKAELIDQFNIDMARTQEDFAYNMRSVRENAQINMKTLVDKYGLSSEKLAIELEKTAFDFRQKAEDLVGTYINNSRNVIA